MITPDKGADVREAVGKVALNNGWAPREIRFETASLEQFFVQITAEQEQARESDVA